MIVNMNKYSIKYIIEGIDYGYAFKSGEIEKQSFEMALEEINAAGGIKGKKLEFLIVDETGKPEKGSSVMRMRSRPVRSLISISALARTVMRPRPVV